MTKTCRRCGETRPLAEFPTAPRMRDGHLNQCRKCVTAYRVDWRRRNPIKDDTTVRRSHLKRRYGITEVDYDKMLEVQGGTCAICHRPNKNGYRLYVDHCHTTGDVRGLLCEACNFGLGKFEDCQDRLRAAAHYLDVHQSSQRRKTD